VAIYHLNVNKVTRTTGRSAVAAAAYRSATLLHDFRTGLTHDFRRKKGIEATTMVTPKGAKWVFDRESLWNTAEAAENRKNSATAREWRVALPSELNDKQRLELSKKLAHHLASKFSVAVDVAIHEPDTGENANEDSLNYHAHLLTTTRVVTPEGLGAKTRELDQSTTSSALVSEVREWWADACNDALEAAGSLNRVDHRTLEAQKKAAEARGDHEAAKLLDRAPQVHRGPIRSRIKETAQYSELQRYHARKNADEWTKDPVKLKNFEADWAIEAAISRAESSRKQALAATWWLEKYDAPEPEITAASALHSRFWDLVQAAVENQEAQEADIAERLEEAAKARANEGLGSTFRRMFGRADQIVVKLSEHIEAKAREIIDAIKAEERPLRLAQQKALDWAAQAPARATQAAEWAAGAPKRAAEAKARQEAADMAKEQQDATDRAARAAREAAQTQARQEATDRAAQAAIKTAEADRAAEEQRRKDAADWAAGAPARAAEIKRQADEDLWDMATTPYEEPPKDEATKAAEAQTREKNARWRAAYEKSEALKAGAQEMLTLSMTNPEVYKILDSYGIPARFFGQHGSDSLMDRDAIQGKRMKLVSHYAPSDTVLN